MTDCNWVCGIDAGSFNTVNHVAWLKRNDFFLDFYQPSETAAFPEPPSIVNSPIKVFAIDAPQGLPKTGNRRRLCDKEAKTPTSVLPQNRADLENWKLYQGLIDLGIKTFWWAHKQGEYAIFGLPAKPTASLPIVAETYPRKVIEAFWLELRDIPSKKKAPYDYVKVVWDRLKEAGYRCDSVIHPTVDQIDAMLCAVAGQSILFGQKTYTKLGENPIIDKTGHLIREGFIVVPAFDGSKP